MSGQVESLKFNFTKTEFVIWAATDSCQIKGVAIYVTYNWRLEKQNQQIDPSLALVLANSLVQDLNQ